MNAVTKYEGGALSQVLRYEPESGDFYWTVNRRGGSQAGHKAGTTKVCGYIQIHALGRLHYGHRLAWLFTTGQWPKGHIDHIDGNPANNRIANLRDVTVATNMQNQRRAHRSNRSSGLLGVSFDKQTGLWSSKISINNRTQNLGRFDSPEAAHAAYLSAKKQLHSGAPQ